MLWEESSSVHTKGGRDKLVGARGKRQSQSVGCRFACIVDCGLWIVARGEELSCSEASIGRCLVR